MPSMSVLLPSMVKLSPVFEPELLHGVMVLKGAVKKKDGGTAEMTAIPYCDWENRGEGEMRLWFPVEGAVHGE